jgi:hypothetical protein
MTQETYTGTIVRKLLEKALLKHGDDFWKEGKGITSNVHLVEDMISAINCEGFDVALIKRKGGE